MDVVEAYKVYGSKRKAAAALGMSRTTFRRRLKGAQGKEDMHKHEMSVSPRIEHCGDALMQIFGYHRDESVHDSRIEDEKQRKHKTALLLYDIHLPHESEESIELALDYAQTKHNIDIVVLGGDFMDCHKISRWKKDPFDGMPFHEEVEYAVNWLERLRSRFPNSECYAIKGNHEDRLQNYLWNQAPEISRLKGLTIQEQLELDRIGFKWIDNLKLKSETGKFFSIGKLHLIHGHELGICPRINPARQYFLRSFDNVVCGHVHKVDDHYATTIADSVLGAFVVGPLCDMHPDYRPQNDWVAGFGLCSFDDDGMFSMKLKKIIDGRVL